MPPARAFRTGGADRGPSSWTLKLHPAAVDGGEMASALADQRAPMGIRRAQHAGRSGRRSQALRRRSTQVTSRSDASRRRLIETANFIAGTAQVGGIARGIGIPARAGATENC